MYVLLRNNIPFFVESYLVKVNTLARCRHLSYTLYILSLSTLILILQHRSLLFLPQCSCRMIRHLLSILPSVVRFRSGGGVSPLRASFRAEDQYSFSNLLSPQSVRHSSRLDDPHVLLVLHAARYFIFKAT
ncbi:hypothetical protein E2C01_058591 [Portunus trituberculatus]|uniref:Uncharacterized protein n=1 Tax=Portunus trituberculatus TaxID=210409 RepID=A0A5B7H6K0_PORTR|nr:hypothetical protein [Portunus trituberculatus]